MENWEETVIEDTFPEAGEIYFLRPRGNPPSVVERDGNWGKYYMLKGMFWIYTNQDPKNPSITQDSPMIMHNFNIKPGILHDFVGKWNDTSVFHCECKVLQGGAKRLKIIKVYKAPVVHSQPPPTPSPPNPESEAVQVPIQPTEQPRAQLCSHPPTERVYTSDTVYICGVCDQRVVVV